MPINLYKLFFPLWVALLCVSNVLQAQVSKGFKTINYSNEQYKAGVHNWHIEQDNKNILFVANAQGVVIFNGFYWQITKLPNNPHVRSLLKSKENILYVGAQNEFGTLKETPQGYRYESLISKIPGEKHQFNDIWDIIEKDNYVFFREPSQIFRYEKGKDIILLKPEGTWSYMGKVNETVMAQDSKLGLLQ